MIRLMSRNAPAEAALPARSYPGFFSSARSFALPAGTQFGADGVRGYYIDLRVKAEAPEWPSAALTFKRGQKRPLASPFSGRACPPCPHIKDGMPLLRVASHEPPGPSRAGAIDRP